MVSTRRTNESAFQDPDRENVEGPGIEAEEIENLPDDDSLEEESIDPSNADSIAIESITEPENSRQGSGQGNVNLGDFINEINQLKSVLPTLQLMVNHWNATQQSEPTQRPVRENPDTEEIPPRQVVSYCPEENRLDPMTSKGQKLILEISKPSIEPGKTLQITQKNGTSILKHVIALSQKIDFRTVLEIRIDGESRSILRSHDRITCEDIRKHNFSRLGCWGYNNQPGNIPNVVSIANDLFNTTNDNLKIKAQRQLDLRTRNQILQRFLSNLCDAGDLERIKIRNADILEIRNPDDVGSKMIDGAVLLKIVLDKCSPSTLSKIDNIKSELAAMKMSDFNDNVELLLDEFEAKVLMIEDMGGQIEEKFKYLFRALQTSTNDDFNQDIRTMRMKYYRGDGKSFEEVTRAAHDLYKNMVADDAWGKKSEKDIHIAALTTKLSNLTQITKALVSTIDSTNSKEKKDKEERPDWKFIFKGDKLEQNGRTYHWCPDPSHSKTKEQQPPGMYCISHGNGSGVSHADSRKKLDEKQKGSKESAPKAPPKSESNKEGKISLSDKLKSAISAHTTMTSNDIEELLNDQGN
jgi:hypothetical protein